MAKVYFNYGTMNSGKSLDLLRTAHAYEEQGKTILLYTSALDNRDGVGYISSRASNERREAKLIEHDSQLDKMIEEECQFKGKVDCVLIDEAQFLSAEQVLQLLGVAEQKDIPVVTYGLKNTFDNDLFEGAKALLVYAHSLKEIKSVCVHRECNRKATMNLRVDENGNQITAGETILIGGNESYKAVCPYHYFNFNQVK